MPSQVDRSVCSLKAVSDLHNHVKYRVYLASCFSSSSILLAFAMFLGFGLRICGFDGPSSWVFRQLDPSAYGLSSYSTKPVGQF